MLLEISSLLFSKVSDKKLTIYQRWLRFLFKFFAIAVAGLRLNPDTVITGRMEAISEDEEDPVMTTADDAQWSLK